MKGLTALVGDTVLVYSEYLEKGASCGGTTHITVDKTPMGDYTVIINGLNVNIYFTPQSAGEFNTIYVFNLYNRITGGGCPAFFGDRAYLDCIALPKNASRTLPNIQGAYLRIDTSKNQYSAPVVLVYRNETNDSVMIDSIYLLNTNNKAFAIYDSTMLSSLKPKIILPNTKNDTTIIQVASKEGPYSDWIGYQNHRFTSIVVRKTINQKIIFDTVHLYLSFETNKVEDLTVSPNEISFDAYKNVPFDTAFTVTHTSNTLDWYFLDLPKDLNIRSIIKSSNSDTVSVQYLSDQVGWHEVYSSIGYTRKREFDGIIDSICCWDVRFSVYVYPQEKTILSPTAFNYTISLDGVDRIYRLSTDHVLSKNTSFELFDQLGRRIDDIAISMHNNSILISSRNRSLNGLYFIRIADKSYHQIEKLMLGM
jgi:hypothetical protein